MNSVKKMRANLLLLWIAALFLGGIGTLAYAPYHIPLISFISYSGLLFLIASVSKKRASLLAFSWGVSYFLFGVYWVYVSVQQFGGVPPIVAGLLVLLLISYLALYPLLFAWGLRACNRIAPPFSLRQLLLLAPLLWMLTEYLRGSIMNGFAWLQFGYTQLDLPSRSWFSLIGIDGVNLLFTFFCGSVVYLIHQVWTHYRTPHHSLKPTFLATLIPLVCVVSTLSVNSFHWVTKNQEASQKVALIQGNIEQSLKWQRGQLEQTKQLYLNEIEKAAPNHDLIILPEGAIPNLEIREQSYLNKLNVIAKRYNTSIALGMLDFRRIGINQEEHIYNNLVVADPDIPYDHFNQNRYNKHHLVPFGEYTPLAALLKPISDLLQIPMSDMSAGASIQPPIKMKGLSLVVAICYEIILTDRILDNFTPDTNFILTISNDGWFGDTIGPWQHLQMAQARALEFGRPVLRSTNTGITAIIDENGKIQSQIPQFEQLTLSDTVYQVNGNTPYSIFGKSIYYLMLATLMLALLLINLFIRYRRPNHNE